VDLESEAAKVFRQQESHIRIIIDDQKALAAVFGCRSWFQNKGPGGEVV